VLIFVVLGLLLKRVLTKKNKTALRGADSFLCCEREMVELKYSTAIIFLVALTIAAIGLLVLAKDLFAANSMYDEQEQGYLRVAGNDPCKSVETVHDEKTYYYDNTTTRAEIVEFVAKLKSLVDYEEPYTLARKIFAKSGAYPISFDLPSKYFLFNVFDENLSAVEPFNIEFLKKAKTRDLAFIVPNVASTYIYRNELDYRRSYEDSWKARTMKKAGWDCNRHVEIMAAGCIPVFTNTKLIPSSIMTFYPKKLFAFVEDNQQETNIFKLAIIRHFIIDWASKFLKFKSIVKYMANVTEISLTTNGTRFAYLDDHLPNEPDYLSSVILGGLVENLGIESVDIFYPAPYLSMNGPWHLKSGGKIYGQGFGNSHYLPVYTPRSFDDMYRDLKDGKYAGVAYGCFTRTQVHYQEVVKIYKRNQIWVGACNDEPRTAPFDHLSTSFIRELVDHNG
jgi:hypothetical protein